MTRKKKSRSNLLEVLQRPPRKQELLADPTSREARRNKNLAKKKRHVPVADRVEATEPAEVRDRRAGRKGTKHGGRLADKIRKLNAEKQAAGEDKNAE